MRSVPPVGGETQPIMRMVEDLPAPLGPRKPNASPRRDVDVDAVHRGEVAEALDQATGVDQGFVSHARTLARASDKLLGAGAGRGGTSGYSGRGAGGLRDQLVGERDHLGIGRLSVPSS